MDNTFLKLRGWVAYKLVVEEQQAIFLHNPHTGVVINIRQILYNEFRILLKESPNYILCSVSYEEVPEKILKQAFDIDNLKTMGL